MQRRWRTVLVDEFQDTDPIQWQVLERAFSGQSTLILIGDPKQAIYGFRGGDIHTYLKAARTADTRYTLGVNWRSDKVLVDSLQTVLRGATLGHPDIVVRDVDALVLPDEALSENLLGLSFLSRLKRFEYSDGQMVLQQ